jgi:tryptophan 2,3-dioxygenase
VKQETVSYGNHPEQIIDYWYPDSYDRLIVLIHGGFWRQQHDRQHLVPLAVACAERGAAVALPEYRRIGGAGGYPGTFADIADAVDSIATPMVLAGHSAGGHLALWAAARHLLPADSHWKLPDPPNIATVVGIAAVSDLEECLRLGLDDNAAGELLGSPDRLPETDPMRLVPTGIPTTLIHGRADNRVPFEMSERYAAKTDARFVALDNIGHFELIQPDSEVTLTAIFEAA